MRKTALAVLVFLAAPTSARADAPRAEDTTHAHDDAQLPYATPRETLVPGTPGMPGGYHVMLNAFGYAHDVGLGGHRISNPNVASFNGGATYPLLSNDWVMGYGRDAGGWVEGLVMLNLEPLTVTSAGIPELGQSGEGLWDAQHAHQLVHQAMIALHPLAGLDGWHPESMMREGRYDLSAFAGQGSATIGPPIFMHRASSPGPTVPRKHHKGENPHETFPVIGASLRVDDTWIEASAFSALELTPQDSRLYPHVAAPSSFAMRVRHVFAGWLEMQISGERLRDPNGGGDASQLSASAYAWGSARGWRLDGLVDWAVDLPDPEHGVRRAASALLGELAVRSPDRRDIVWVRSEFNQREEPSGVVSTAWFFETLGFERVIVGGKSSGVQLGLFAEATYTSIPPSLRGSYGTDAAVTLDAGLHVFGMWMLDGALRPMGHHAM